MYKFIALIVLFLGEALSIYSELALAEKHNPSPMFVVKMLIVLITGCVMLLLGYYFGYKSFKNIWIVSAISVGAILISEPILSWAIFHEVPTRGAAVGFSLGALGLLATIFL